MVGKKIATNGSDITSEALLAARIDGLTGRDRKFDPPVTAQPPRHTSCPLITFARGKPGFSIMAVQGSTLVSDRPILVASVRPSSYDQLSLRAACAREIHPHGSDVEVGLPGRPDFSSAFGSRLRRWSFGNLRIGRDTHPSAGLLNIDSFLGHGRAELKTVHFHFSDGYE